MSTLSYQELLAGLTHEDIFVRSGILLLLAESGIECQPDASLAALGILEKYDWDQAFSEQDYLQFLPVDSEIAEKIIDWLLRHSESRLNQSADELALHTMLEWLAKAPIEAVSPHAEKLEAIPIGSPIEKQILDSIRLNGEIQKSDAIECAEHLESCINRITDGADPMDSLSEIRFLVRRLTELDKIDVNQVRQWAELSPAFADEFLMTLDEARVCVAFEMANAAAIPIDTETCIKHLEHEEEWLSEIVLKNMIANADEAMFDEMLKSYPNLDDDRKIDWLLFFEKARFTGKEEQIRDLATLEKNLSFRSHLGLILCFHRNDPGLKYARETFESMDEEIEAADMLEPLYALTILKNRQSPEVAEWRIILDEIHTTTLQMLSELNPDMLHYDNLDFDDDDADSSQIADFNTITSQIKAGRNDDCPCGSGRKYKKCCITK